MLTFVASGTWEAAFFDYWAIEAEEPPIVLLPEMYYPLTYSNFWLTGTPMNAAAVDQVNAAVRTIAAEFPDGRCLYVDGFNEVMNPGSGTTRFQPDGIHPNVLGAGELAGVLFAALSPTAAQLASTGAA